VADASRDMISAANANGHLQVLDPHLVVALPICNMLTILFYEFICEKNLNLLMYC
jgi:hypothetical protein